MTGPPESQAPVVARRAPLVVCQAAAVQEAEAVAAEAPKVKQGVCHLNNQRGSVFKVPECPMIGGSRQPSALAIVLGAQFNEPLYSCRPERLWSLQWRQCSLHASTQHVGSKQRMRRRRAHRPRPWLQRHEQCPCWHDHMGCFI